MREKIRIYHMSFNYSKFCSSIMGTRCGLHNTKIQNDFFLVIYELNVLALIPKVSGSVLDSAGRQDPSYCERTPSERKTNVFPIIKFLRAIKFYSVSYNFEGEPKLFLKF